VKLKTRLEKSGGSMHYIPIPDEIGEEIIRRFGRRVICKVNGNQIHCAILKRQSIGTYIMAGKSTREKIKANYKDELNLEILEDTTEFQMEVGEVFQEVLDTDEEGKIRFKELTDGKKRSLIHQVNKAKNIDTQINRALKILENLKMGFTDLKDLTR